MNTLFPIREHYAYTQANMIREFYGHPIEFHKYMGSQFWRSIFHRKTWGKYYERGY